MAWGREREEKLVDRERFALVTWGAPQSLTVMLFRCPQQKLAQSMTEEGWHWQEQVRSKCYLDKQVRFLFPYNSWLSFVSFIRNLSCE
jgi:hypothetical protein